MKKQLTAITLLAALCGTSFSGAIAADTQKPVAKKQVKKSTKAVAAAVPAAASRMPFNSDEEDNEHEPDVSETTSWQMACELGNSITVFANDTDNRHIAIRWQNRINRLTRVATSTGANRFENKKAGLLWIDIPTKGMLLDTKKGRQLANECTQSGNKEPRKG